MNKFAKPTLLLIALNASLSLAAVYVGIIKPTSGLPVEEVNMTVSTDDISGNPVISERISVDYSFLNEKALFHESRQKIEMEEVTEPKRAETRKVPISDFILQGIVFTDDAKSVVYLINKRSSEEFNLRVNDQVDGWQVTEIYRNYINLDNGGQLAQLNLLNEQ